jgi:dihydropyrimidinase
MTYDALIRGGMAVLPGRGVQSMDIAVADGRVAALEPPGQSGADTAREIIDAAGLYVLPGIIDPHTHFGLATGLADWETESHSAAVGGVTTVINFLMSGDPYDDEYHTVRETADRTSYVDYALHLVPSSEEHLVEMPHYMRDLGITSFKYFTSFRGNEGAYLRIRGTDDGYLFRYLRLVGQNEGAVACVHAENIEVVWQLRRELEAAGRDDLAAWDDSRPDWVEADCVHRAMLFARQVDAPLYLVHTSAALCLEEVRSARARWPEARIYVETCPHFLTHTSESRFERYTLGKINPPLRHQADVDALWAGLADGTVQTIGSDHSARRKEKKSGTIWTSAAGFPGSGTILPVLLSEGFHRRGLPLERIVELTSTNAARIFGLYPRKGTIEVGSDADLVLVDLGRQREVEASTFQSYSDYNLYEGWTLTGWPVLTMRRGEVTARDGRILGAQGTAQYLSRVAGLQ